MKRKYYGPTSRSVRRRTMTNKAGFWGNLGAGVAGLGAMAYEAYRKTGSSKSGIGVTSQYDKTSVYRKKRMPKRKKRQWVKFVKKVRSALMKDVGTKTVIRNDTLSTLWSTNDQSLQTITVYGADGSAPTASQCGHNDLKTIFTNDPDLSAETARAKFGSAIVDITFTNASVNAGPENNNTGLEIDIYDIVYRKQLDAPTLGNAITDS